MLDEQKQSLTARPIMRTRITCIAACSGRFGQQDKASMSGNAAGGDVVDRAWRISMGPFRLMVPMAVDRATVAAAGIHPCCAGIQQQRQRMRPAQADAEAQGLAIPDPAQLEKGDIIMYNRYSKPDPNWHVVVYDGNGGCWGNSSNVYGCFHHYEGSIDMGERLLSGDHHQDIEGVTGDENPYISLLNLMEQVSRSSNSPSIQIERYSNPRQTSR